MYLLISRVMTLLASVFITIGLYAQAMKLWKSKSGQDFSAALVSALIVNEVVWLNYGISLMEWPIILISGNNIPAILAIMLGYKRYGKGKEKGNEQAASLS